MAFTVTVEGFGQGAGIPRRFTCDGENVSPEIRWTGEPPSTKSFALIVDDPDAPGGVWTHWLVWDIPANIHSLPESRGFDAPLKSGTNDFGERRYGGPCPPRGKGAHRYFFRLFALDTASLGLPDGASRASLEKAIRRHTVGETAYMGKYERR